jgi:hypothetical protein
MEDLQAKLDAANESLAGVMPYRLAFVDPDEIELLTKNARFMRNDTFRQLVDNVKRDGQLSSVPLLYGRKALSGNHRVMAAREAKKAGALNGGKVLCLEWVGEMGGEQQVAMQLSHNAIAGEDNLQVLKDLYDGIADLGLKAYSGIDEELRKKLAELKLEQISEPRLIFKTVTLMFLPAEIDQFKQILKDVEKLLAEDLTYVAKRDDYLPFFEMLADAKDGLNIKNSAVALLEIMKRGLEAVKAAKPEQQNDGTTDPSE